MTVNYYTKPDGRCWFRTDRTKPRDGGKFIGGIATSLAEARQSVELYLGHSDFEMIQVAPVTPEKAEVAA